MAKELIIKIKVWDSLYKLIEDQMKINGLTMEDLSSVDISEFNTNVSSKRNDFIDISKRVYCANEIVNALASLQVPIIFVKKAEKREEGPIKYKG